MGYICRFCGHKSSHATGGHCSKAPGGSHEYIAEADSYICSYCGHKSSQGTCGHCSKSPTGYHVYMAGN